MASSACKRGCRAFHGWTVEHFHADDRPNVVVFHTPEQPGPRVTTHEGWGTDGDGKTATFLTASEAVAFAKRYFDATVALGQESPRMTDNARYSPRKVTDLADVKQPSSGPAPGANADPDVRNDLVRWLLDHGYAEEKQGYGHVTADELAGALVADYGLLRIGTVPPWMEECGRWSDEPEDMGDGPEHQPYPLYRVKP